MAQYVLAYLATAIVFFALDYVWLAYVARSFYQKHIGPLLLESPNMAAAAGFYAVYIVGIVIFAVSPALKSASASHALIYGALFGFFAYATYDMTNIATLKGWSWTVVIIDTAWGTFLTGIAALLGYLATSALTNSGTA